MRRILLPSVPAAAASQVTHSYAESRNPHIHVNYDSRSRVRGNEQTCTGALVLTNRRQAFGGCAIGSDALHTRHKLLRRALVHILLRAKASKRAEHAMSRAVPTHIPRHI